MPADNMARLEGLLEYGVQTVELMLTTTCNFRCAYCYQRRRAPRTMPSNVLDAAIRQLVTSRLDRPRLTLFGGEPLLAVPLVRRALRRVREWAPRRMKPDIQIVTNGTRLDEEMTRLLVSRDVSVTLSFDGVAAAQNDRSPHSFELLDGLLVRLTRSHPRYLRRCITVKVTLTSRNVPFLSESFRYFLSRGVRNVDLYPVIPDDPGWTAPSRLDLDRQLAGVVRISVEEFQRSGEIPLVAFRGAPDPKPRAGGRLACACGSRGLLVVDVDGTVAPCSLLAPSTLGSPPAAIRRGLEKLGGIHVSDPNLLTSLAQREKHAERMRFLAGPGMRRGPMGPCATCKARRTCFVCPVAVAPGGRVPAIHCDVNRLLARHRSEFQRRIKSLTSRRSSEIVSRSG